MGLFVKIRFVREKLSPVKVGLHSVYWVNWVLVYIIIKARQGKARVDHEITPSKALYFHLSFKNYSTFFGLVKNNI